MEVVPPDDEHFRTTVRHLPPEDCASESGVGPSADTLLWGSLFSGAAGFCFLPVSLFKDTTQCTKFANLLL